jgi:hypothetical protein
MTFKVDDGPVVVRLTPVGGKRKDASELRFDGRELAKGPRVVRVAITNLPRTEPSEIIGDFRVETDFKRYYNLVKKSVPDEDRFVARVDKGVVRLPSIKCCKARYAENKDA